MMRNDIYNISLLQLEDADIMRLMLLMVSMEKGRKPLRSTTGYCNLQEGSDLGENEVTFLSKYACSYRGLKDEGLESLDITT